MSSVSTLGYGEPTTCIDLWYFKKGTGASMNFSICGGSKAPPPHIKGQLNFQGVKN